MKRHLFPLAAVGLLLTGYQLFAQYTGIGIVRYNSTGVSQDKRIWADRDGEAVLASGSAYQTALYWGPSGTIDEASLFQVGAAVNFLTGTAAGTFFGGNRTLSGLPQNGAIVAVQSRAWSTEGGSITSYEAALLNGAATGKGPIFELKTEYYPDLMPSIGNTAGWRGYFIVPEPSTYALGALAAAALLLFRRRKN